MTASGPTIRVGRIGALLGLWLLLWGSVSVADVLSGLVVAAVVSWLIPADTGVVEIAPAATAGTGDPPNAERGPEPDAGGSTPRRLSVSWPPIRPVPVLRFTAVVLVDLVRANWVVTRELLTPGSSVRTGVVNVEVPGASPGVLTVVANVLALAPGTMPLAVTAEPPVVSVHVLHLHDRERSRADIARLGELAVRAFGSAESPARRDRIPPARDARDDQP